MRWMGLAVLLLLAATADAEEASKGERGAGPFLGIEGLDVSDPAHRVRYFFCRIGNAAQGRGAIVWLVSSQTGKTARLRRGCALASAGNIQQFDEFARYRVDSTRTPSATTDLRLALRLNEL